MPRIRRIAIKNFRSIHNLEIDVKDLTVLVGDNDCGKSNILRALNLFFNGETNPGVSFNFTNDFNRFAFTPAKKAKQIEIEIDLELPPSYHNNNGEFIRWKKTWRKDSPAMDSGDYDGYYLVEKKRGHGTKIEWLDGGIPAQSNAHTLLRKIEFEYVPAIRSSQYFRNLRGRIYGVIAEVAEAGMRRTSSQFESAISGYVTELLDDINDQLDEEARISMPRDLSNVFENLDFQYTAQDISLDNRGDGIKGRYIPLILKFIADQKRQLATRGSPAHTFIWAYEEPENNLEFRRAQELAETFCELAHGEQTQILMTTHSPIFYNLARDNGDDRCALHVSAPDTQTGTFVVSSSDDELELDERMGVMPIIAPYIAQAETELDRLRAREAEITAQLGALSRPVIYVEGTSDFIVLSAVLSKLRPDSKDMITISEPPTSGAGANFVADNLVAWHLIQKGKLLEDRLKAFGIFDKDSAGKTAAKRVSELTTGNYVNKDTLPLPDRFRDAYRIGAKLPITLEEMYPESYWEHAENEDWLEDRNKRSVVTDTVNEKILNGLTTFEEFVADLGECRPLKLRPKSTKKIKWAQWVARKSSEQLEQDLPELLSCLDSAIEFVS